MHESLKARVNAIRNKLVQQVRQRISVTEGEMINAREDLSLEIILKMIRSLNVCFFLCVFFFKGPCHVELHAALDMIASSQQQLGDKFTTFYLPNCDKHGYYKPKQVSLCFQVLLPAPKMYLF